MYSFSEVLMNHEWNCKLCPNLWGGGGGGGGGGRVGGSGPLSEVVEERAGGGIPKVMGNGRKNREVGTPKEGARM